jgi:hypothetical protein
VYMGAFDPSVDLRGVEPLAGNSSRQSVRYLPQNTPSSSISFGARSGRKAGSKLRPVGAANS